MDLDRTLRDLLSTNDTPREESLAEALENVLDLHTADENGKCFPCNLGTSGGAIAWPCPTVELMAEPLGFSFESTPKG